MEEKETLEQRLGSKIRVLVVEDRLENIDAAKRYFGTRADVEVEYTATLQEGLDRMHENLYDVGIFDLELPQTEGAEPKPMGYKLALAANSMGLQWALVTAGASHADTKTTNTKFAYSFGLVNGSRKADPEDRDKVFYSDTWYGVDESQKDYVPCIEVDELTDVLSGNPVPKTEPKAWQHAFETLLKYAADTITEWHGAKNRFLRTGRTLGELESYISKTYQPNLEISKFVKNIDTLKI